MAESDLRSFVAAMGGERQLRVEESLEHGFVVLRVSEAERRQAKHDVRCVEDVVIELLRNARDAGARRIFLASSREGDLRTLTMVDDGQGIPESLHERIFEARVTSKLDTVHMDRWGLHGRGMALFAVHENAQSARVVASSPGKGTSIQVVADVSQLSERADQSSWPVLGRDEEGRPCVTRGPHNVARTCCEFALEEAACCEVFLGSPAEIVATLVAAGASRDASGEPEEAALALVERPSRACDARDLARIAQGLGLEVSERTAYRILSGEIEPLPSVRERVMPAAAFEPMRREVDLLRDRRGLRIARQDQEEFLRIMERDFAYLAERYYLSLTAAPKLRYAQGRLQVTFELESED